MTFQIRNWERHFENSRSRTVEKLCWVPMPNHHDGNAFCELMDDENGAATYGCWALVVQVGSKCQPRGTLLKSNGEPHDAASLARMVRVPIPTMKTAIEKLLKIGWLIGDCQASDGQPSGVRQASSHIREWNRREDSAVKRPTAGGLSCEQRQEDKPNAAAKTNIWALWIDANREKGREDPKPVGANTAAARELGKVLPSGREKEILAAYLNDSDPFLEKNGFALSLLPKRIDKYLNQDAGGTDADGLSEFDRAANRLAKQLRAKRKATE